MTNHVRSTAPALGGVLLGAFLLVGVTAPAAAQQAGGAEDASIAELRAYQLELPKVQAWRSAALNIGHAVHEDPGLAERLKANADESLDQAVARLSGEPGIKEAIESTGLSTRDYALTTVALFQAMFAHTAMQSGQLEELPAGINPGNVEFVKANEGEIRKIMQELQTPQSH